MCEPIWGAQCQGESPWDPRDGAVRQKGTLQLWRASRSRGVTCDFVLLKGDTLPGVCREEGRGSARKNSRQATDDLGLL